MSLSRQDKRLAYAKAANDAVRHLLALVRNYNGK